jgi:hypothetical protein
MYHRYPHYALISAAFVLMTGAFLPLHAATAPDTARPADTVGASIASGASEDSLKACLTRIPKDATEGQRLIAEQSCRRDDGERKPFQATLGR